MGSGGSLTLWSPSNEAGASGFIDIRAMRAFYWENASIIIIFWLFITAFDDCTVFQHCH